MSQNTIKEYLMGIGKLTEQLQVQPLEEVIRVLKQAREAHRTIFVLGNGGSAATANHFTCDFGKNAVKGDKQRFRVISLCDNSSYITAYGNDCGYENVFVEQLKNLMNESDVLLAISASGNSPNVIKAVEYAKENRGKVISLTGFQGGRLKSLSDLNINIEDTSYEKIEDLHSIITHIVVYFFKQASVL